MPRKRILIVSEATDLHANAIAYALRKKGHLCECLYTPDFPTLLGVSMRVEQEDSAGRFHLRGPGLENVDQSQPFDTVWLRRPGAPVMPDDMHPGDLQIASRQSELFLLAIAPFVDRDPKTFWVNPYTSDRIAEHKPCQLRTAADSGLKIPTTLFSNDPVEIRAFFREHGGTVAHKLLRPASWSVQDGDKERVYAAYTVPVDEDDLPEDDVLRLCPGIFQPYVEKDFEVRAACLGEHVVAVRINSQTDERAATDWRAGQIYVDMEPYELPADIADGCRRFLKTMKLNHASFDFVVTPEGEHVFLEINPQGQFLFLETRADLPLLDMFSEYLIAGRHDFQWREDHEVIRFSEFEKTWDSTWAEVTAKHKRLRRALGAPENSRVSDAEDGGSNPS